MERFDRSLLHFCEIFGLALGIKRLLLVMGIADFNPARLTTVAKVIERHLEWLESHKTRTVVRHRNADKGEHVHLFHQTPLGSGMDNIPLHGDGWVDMSSQMYLAYEQLSQIYQRLARKSTYPGDYPDEYFHKAGQYHHKAEALKAAINQCLWSEADGFYFNVSGNCGSKVKRYTLASIWPMFAGIATKDHADKMVEKLFDPNLFYTDVPFPVLAKNDHDYKDEGGYWRGGVWAPTNYMVIRSLMNYGYMKKAREATTRYLDALAANFKKSGTLYEYYNVHGEQGYNPLNRSSNTQDHYARDNFVGWTGLGPISLMIELMIGVRVEDASSKRLSTIALPPEAPEAMDEQPAGSTVYWNLAGNDASGIENLNINGKRLTLMKSRRYHDDDTAFIRVTAKGRFPYAPKRLVIIHNQNVVTLSLERDINNELIAVPPYRQD